MHISEYQIYVFYIYMYVWVIGVHPHQPKIIQVVIEKLASGFHEENYDAKMKQTKGKAYISAVTTHPKAHTHKEKMPDVCVCVFFSGDPPRFWKISPEPNWIIQIIFIWGNESKYSITESTQRKDHLFRLLTPFSVFEIQDAILPRLFFIKSLGIDVRNKRRTGFAKTTIVCPPFKYLLPKTTRMLISVISHTSEFMVSNGMYLYCMTPWLETC